MKLAETVTFAASGVERAAHLRDDAAALTALRQSGDAGFLPLWKGRPLVEEAADGAVHLALVAAGHEVLSHASAEPLFLGLAGAQARFGVDVSGWVPSAPVAETGGFVETSRQPLAATGEGPAFAELRQVMAALPIDDAALAATARSLVSWHDSHGFCAACGAPTVVSMAGWQRDCPACGVRHFPRTDPVVIMLVTHGNAVLLGRSPGWPEGMYSLLAGFVEPGETIADAVRREVAEEAGVAVGPVGILASQPWPYPSSLMIGCTGRALDRAITLDEKELEEAIWLSREEVLDAFAGRHARMRPPRRGAIARFLLRNWLADRLD